MGAAGPGGELWFYHLESGGLEEALATLLEKCLARGWRALVRAPGEGRLKALDGALWTYRDASFLPHGLDGPDAARQPVLLTSGFANANGSSALFLIDDAEPGDLAGFERACLLFNGADPTALAAARARWKACQAAGITASYWRRTADGAWTRNA